ncbi:MAG: hemerythrin [Comamonadaceae bacterium]|nr:MAG: hemerythrin [Comamonadaceae bacterium]
MSIEWNESYKIGQAEIDQQHQHLFALTRALLEETDETRMRSLIMLLYKHTREHFELEEHLMRQLNFPDLHAHVHDHSHLLGKLNAISKEMGQGVFNKPALEQLMGDWTLRHILQDDAALAAFMR